MMARETDGRFTLLVVVSTLYLLAIFALADFAIVLTQFAHREADSTMATSLVLIFTSSILSMIYISLHVVFAYRLRQAGQKRQKRTCLESITRFLPRVLIICWIAASANGLVVAARQPRCMPAMASQDLWRAGLSCVLHRSATGMAVGTLIITCILFCSIEVSGRPFHASPAHIYRRRRDSSFGLSPSPSELSCSPSPSSSLNSCESKKTDLGSRGLARQLSDRAFWLQRQNSLSSRNAIYPPCLRQSYGVSGCTLGSLRSASAPHARSQQHWSSSSLQYSLRIASTSSSTSASIPLPSVSEYYTSISGFPTRAPSSVSSSSSSSPLSTMRRASQPDVPIIPNRFLSVTSSGIGSSSSSSSSSGRHQPSSRRQPQRRSSLPYAWSPILHHAPLSADPAIRALTTNGSSDDPFTDPKERDILPVEPAVTTSKPLPPRRFQRPDFPSRAVSHRPLVCPTPVVA